LIWWFRLCAYAPVGGSAAEGVAADRLLFAFVLNVLLLQSSYLVGGIKMRYHIDLNARHRLTLDAIFVDPVRASIAWRDIEALLLACGAEVSEGQGSRVRVVLNGVRAVFHRPHPQKETDKGAVKSVRRLFMEAKITP
jgi:hypothetical protein